MLMTKIHKVEKTADLPDMNKSVFIWVWHADKVPPHIGLSIEGNYFSLKVNGKDELVPVEKVMHLLSKKKIASLFIELNTSLTLDIVTQSYADYTFAKKGSATCLTPIKRILSEDHSIDRLADLLELLESRNEIANIFGLNLPSGYIGLQNYNASDISNRLELLSNAKRN